jgi:UDP-N-acetylglucosamine 1-carboxyvinyltransferase
MGAKISGAGTHEITIEGVDQLHGTLHEILPDRIEAGTYIMAAIATNSEIEIGPFVSNHLNIVLKKLKDAGANFEIINRDGQEYFINHQHDQLTAQNIDTRTYPGFPTDLQSQYAALMTQAKGECTIFETIFEGRFLYLDEIAMMEAKVEVLSPHITKILGPTELEGAQIYSRDFRGGAALVIAGLIAKGETRISGVEFIDRGYENMDVKLAAAGANIKRVEE